MRKTTIAIGFLYTYMAIEAWADDNGFTMEEHGNDYIGEHLVVLKKEDTDQVISFVMTGYSSAGASYMCAYSDLEK